MVSTNKIGHPVMLGEAVGRIVGSEFMRVLVATPHGTVIESGIFWLHEITPDGMKRLREYEAMLKKDNKEMYAGKLNESDIK